MIFGHWQRDVICKHQFGELNAIFFKNDICTHHEVIGAGRKRPLHGQQEKAVLRHVQRKNE